MDRTGDIEKKRTARIKRAGKIKEEAKTYDALVSILPLLMMFNIRCIMKILGIFHDD